MQDCYYKEKLDKVFQHYSLSLMFSFISKNFIKYGPQLHLGKSSQYKFVLKFFLLSTIRDLTVVGLDRPPLMNISSFDSSSIRSNECQSGTSIHVYKIHIIMALHAYSFVYMLCTQFKVGIIPACTDASNRFRR